MITSTGKLLSYDILRKYSRIFIETGAASGDGIQRALDAGFEVYSIEASPEWFDHCVKRFLGNTNVNMLLGMSVDELPFCIDYLNKHPLVIMLDAHVSGESSAGYDDYLENGDESEFAQDKVIKAELDIILVRGKNHVIVIDDVCGLSDGHAMEYVEIIRSVNPDYKFYFYDENLSDQEPKEDKYFYKDKLLVCIP